MTVPIDLLRDGLVNARVSAPTPEPAAGLAEADRVASTSLGVCQLCKDRAATTRCLNCEDPVCPADMWIMFGLCRRCLTEDEVRATRERKEKARPDLGIKWIED